MKRLSTNKVLLSLVLIVLIFTLTYGLTLPGLGFYSDDWFFTWVGHTQGLNGLISSLTVDRPFSGVLLGLDYLAFGINPLAWQIFGFAVRLLAVLGFWWMLRQLRPNQILVVTSAALLFALYPGFLQTWDPLLNQNWLVPLALSMFSLAFTVKSVNATNSRTAFIFLLLSVVSMIIAVLIVELFVAIEPLRLAIVWVLSAQNNKSRRQILRSTAKKYIPYFVSLIPVGIWRVFFFTSTRADTSISAVTNLYRQQPLATIVNKLFTIPVDFLSSSTFAWFAPAYSRLEAAGIRELIFSLFLGAVGGVLFILFCSYCIRRFAEPPEESRSWGAGLVPIGFCATLLGVIPVIVANRRIILLNSYDRYTLVVLAGACILFVGLIWVALHRRAAVALLAVVIALSMTTQLLDATLYRRAWDLEKDLWWQFSWRVPNLTPQTVLVMEAPKDYNDNQYYLWWGGNIIWAGANLIYNFDSKQTRIGGMFLDETNIQQVVQQGINDDSLRNVTVKDDLRNGLIVTMPTANSCLRVIDGATQVLPTDSDALLREAAPFSHIDRVLTDNAARAIPPAAIFGSEPPHSWCYTFEQADLARQAGDWASIVQLGSAADQQKLQPTDLSEWLVFVEGAINAGQYDQAKTIISRLVASDQPVKADLCRLLTRLQAKHSGDAGYTSLIAGLPPELACTPSP